MTSNRGCLYEISGTFAYRARYLVDFVDVISHEWSSTLRFTQASWWSPESSDAATDDRFFLGACAEGLKCLEVEAESQRDTLLSDDSLSLSDADATLKTTTDAAADAPGMCIVANKRRKLFRLRLTV